MDIDIYAERINRYIERNLLEEMKAGEVEFELAEDFLIELKKRIWRRR